MGISLVMVPLTLTCLDNKTFGVWTTLSSLLTLLTFFDIGLGNGLRNRLAEALSANDSTLARSYVSTAYVLFGGVQLFLLVLFLITNTIIPWPTILNTSLPVAQLRQVALVLFIGVSLKLVFDLLTFALYARQETAKAGLLLLLTNLVTLAGLLGLTYVKRGNLITLSFLNAISPLLILLTASLLLYGGSLRSLQPSWRLVKKQYVTGLLGLGSKFFIIQLAVIVIFYSDNLIIAQLFGPEEVTSYSISFRYFNIINILFSIAITPFWSAFTEAYNKQEYNWMRASYQRLWWLWLGVVVLAGCWVIMAPYAYKVWIGDRVQISRLLSLCMGLSVIIACLNNVTVVVTNGLGKIKLQLISSVFSALINIPLSVVLGKYLNMGSSGVILATSLSLIIGSTTGLLQARRLINQTATGIWNR